MTDAPIKKWLLTLLPEIFGVTDLAYGYILDHGKAGILGTIDSLEAIEASTAPNPGAETIASHIGHTLYLMELFGQYADGMTPETDWPGSWKNQIVDDAGWLELKNKLWEIYKRNLARIEREVEWGDDVTAACLILLGHCSYHLGEIKQLCSSTVTHSPKN